MDIFLIHGKIWQGEGRFCEAMVVRQGRIAAVGEQRALAGLAADCRVLDCGWRTVIPGLFEPFVCLEKACGPLPFGTRHRKEGLRRWLRQAARAGYTTVQSCDLGGAVQKGDLPMIEQLYREEKNLPRLQFILPQTWPSLRGHRWEERLPGFGGRMLSLENLPLATRAGGQRWISVDDGATLELFLEQLRWEPLPEGNPRRLTLLGVPCTSPRQLVELGAAAVNVVAFPARLEDSLAACAVHPDTCCAWRTLSHLGARVAFGSYDRFAPFAGLQKALCRREILPTGSDRSSPEALTLEEGLLALTRDAARTDFREDFTGTLAPGYRADFVVTDRDIFTASPQTLAAARSVLTVSGGRVLWDEIGIDTGRKRV
ncbi:MAG: amidohydrolase family protein [Clostridia bacterium]|nr:amidohydrolase family protein [Clostridia bacterium]